MTWEITYDKINLLRLSTGTTLKISDISGIEAGGSNGSYYVEILMVGGQKVSTHKSWLNTEGEAQAFAKKLSEKIWPNVH